MINFKSIIALMMFVFSLTQCNSQTKKTTTMETTNATKTATKEIIVDVRSVEEWNEDGHADCSVNYPLDQFASQIEELKKYDKGYTKEIENLGPWQNVTCKTK
jgi:3-mercaptopyruvate sulfurtransferase SseA